MLSSSIIHQVTMKLYIFCCFLLAEISAHGRLRDPPSRSSAWRDGFKTPHNYEDDELFCGGISVLWDENKGKCGICGDRWDSPTPRANELGGKYGSGIITKRYKKGQVIDTWVELTTNHLGWYELRLCPLKDNKTDATQECLNQHILQKADGSGSRINVPDGQFNFKIPMKLPEDVTCQHCVMQWDWTGGNNWGFCEGSDENSDDGGGALGCGPQETFRGCADIAIE